LIHDSENWKAKESAIESRLLSRLEQSLKAARLIARSSIESERWNLRRNGRDSGPPNRSQRVHRGTISSFPSGCLPQRGSRRENAHIGDRPTLSARISYERNNPGTMSKVSLNAAASSGHAKHCATARCSRGWWPLWIN